MLLYMFMVRAVMVIQKKLIIINNFLIITLRSLDLIINH